MAEGFVGLVVVARGKIKMQKHITTSPPDQIHGNGYMYAPILCSYLKRNSVVEVITSPGLSTMVGKCGWLMLSG